MKRGKEDELADWFAEVYRNARVAADLKAYRAIDDSDADYQTRLAAKRATREKAGAMLLRGMMRDPESYIALMRKVASAVLMGALKCNRRESRALIDGQYPPLRRSLGRENSSTNYAAAHEPEQVEDELEGLPQYSDTYLPTATLAVALFEMLDDPSKWGEWVCTKNTPNAPIGLVIKRFSQRLMDWLDKNTRRSDLDGPTRRAAQPRGQSIASLLDESSRHYVAGMLDLALLIKESGQERHVSSLSEDRIPAVRQHNYSSNKSLWDEADEQLYAQAIGMMHEYLAVTKKRTGLEYRVAYSLRKLFPEHAWAVQKERRGELEAIQSWTNRALWELRGGESDAPWAEKLAVIKLRIDHDRHWSIDEVKLDDDHIPLLDVLAQRCTQNGTHLPQSIVGILVGVVDPTVLRKATEDPSSDAYTAFRKMTNKLSQPLRRLDDEVGRMMEKLIVLPLQSRWDAQRGEV